ncbi:DUF445 domain-containing protein [Pseudonocardia sp. TMWB2A]
MALNMPKLSVEVPTGGLNVRWVATGLLVVMALVFIATTYFRHVHPAIGFVRAFAEAAMVGGLADWFAVTALFRHPLGLPIPHTAIIPRNKDRIGDTLALFLKDNFLTPNVIARRMQSVDIAGAAGKFLASPSGGEGRMRVGASRLLADMMGALDEERLGGMVKTAIADQIRRLDIAPLLGQALAAGMKEDKHQPVIDSMVGWLAKALDENEHILRDMVHERTNALMRFVGIDEKIANSIVNGLHKLFTEMTEDPDHPFRLKAEEALQKLAKDLQHSKKMQKKVSDFRDELLENPAVTGWIDGLWEQGRTALLKAARDPDTVLAGKLGEALQQMGATLQQDEVLKRTINRFARRAVVGGAAAYGGNIVRLVSDTVRSWDTGTIVNRLETTVGPDLQFIRINGTLVGGLVGVLIHAAEYLL